MMSMIYKVEKPVLFIPEFLAKSGASYNTTLFNWLSNLFGEAEQSIKAYYTNCTYPIPSEKYRMDNRRVPWFLLNDQEANANSFTGLAGVTYGKEGKDLEPKVLPSEFYEAMVGSQFFLGKVKRDPRDIGITISDLENLKHIDIYIKNMCKIGNSLLSFEQADTYSNNLSFNNKAIKLMDLLLDLQSESVVYPEDNRTVFADIVMSKRDKPYEFVPKSNILLIIPRTGFTNLLRANPEQFSSLLQADIVREYQKAFGSEELYGSSLFYSYGFISSK